MFIRAYAGELRLFAGDFAPEGWLVCDGRTVYEGEYPALAKAIGSTYTKRGERDSFMIPDLRGRVVVHTQRERGVMGGSETVQLTPREIPKHAHGLSRGGGDAQNASSPANAMLSGKAPFLAYGTSAQVPMSGKAIATAGGGAPHENMMPFVALNYIIAADGVSTTERRTDNDGFIGEIRPFAFGFEPREWMRCAGQILPIASFMPLFSILGDRFGGDRIRTFALPDLSGRVAIGSGQGPKLTARTVGDTGGEAMVMMDAKQLATHAHQLLGSNANATSAEPRVPAVSAQPIYGDDASPVQMSEYALSFAGRQQPHNNMQPYTAVNYCICVTGIYPPRS